MTNPINSLFIDTAQVVSSFTLGTADFNYDGADIVCAVPIDFQDTVLIGKNVIGSTTTVPLVDLIPHSSTVSLIRLTADVSNALVLRNIDSSANLNSTLDSAGKFFSRRVTANAFAVGTYEQAVGAVTLDYTGPSLFACDASGGDITFELPEIDVYSPSGYQFTFKKTDSSVSTVTVSGSGGQAIDGETDRSITSQWGILRVASVVSGGSGYWITI